MHRIHRPWHRRRFLGAAAAAAGSVVLPAAGAAGDFPERPVTMVVPYPPGGSLDISARIVARGLAAQLGQPVVVDNRPGAGTAIGAAWVARAAADGYTLLYTTNTTFTINPVLRGGLGYDPLQSFTPIGLVGGSSVVLLAHPSVAAGTVAELVALARARPGELNYASFGVGTISHLAGELFKSVAGVDIVHVPHQGSAPAMQALIGGQVQLSFDVLVAAARPIAAGRVKPLVLTSRRRSALLPELPTMIESGYAGFDVAPWAALLAPRGLPRKALDRLAAALSDALADASLSAELRRAGVELAPEPPEAYAPRVEQELLWVRRTAAQAGIKAE